MTHRARLLALPLLLALLAACGIRSAPLATPAAPDTLTAAAPSTLQPGQRLGVDQEVRSGGAVLRYQGDGNLVLYGPSGPLWASNTFEAPGHAEMQGDGNLVLYSAAGVPYWATGTFIPGAWVEISTQGVFVKATTTVWSGTAVHGPPPPPPAPSTLGHVGVEDNKRWFRTETGRLDYREYTAFSLLGQLQHGDEGSVRANLQGMRQRGFTVARVLVTYRYNGPWAGPEQPNFYPSLDRLLQIAGEEGMYVRLVYIGGLDSWGGVWDPVRRTDIFKGSVRAGAEAFVREITGHVCGRPGLLIELANEPGQIGMRDSFHLLQAMGHEVNAICPSLIQGGGAVDGPNDQDIRLAVPPFDYVDAHIERRTGVRGFEWVKRSGEYALIDQDLSNGWRGPFISGEPINFVEGRSNDAEQSPSVAFAYAAVSRARHYNTNFHYDGGLYGRLPEERTNESVRCYHAALDAFPMATDGKWRGHWGLAAGDYWQNVWPDTDDIRGVEDHVARGLGPWRAFGAGIFSVLFPEPEGYNYQVAVEGGVAVERVASCDAGAFQASVYRRR